MDELHRANSDLPVDHRDGLSLPADSVAKMVSDRIPTSSSAGSIPPTERASYTIDAAIANALEQMTTKHFPDAHADIQYWLWIGHRLVPASPEAAERLRQQEALEQAELLLVHERQKAYRQRRQQSSRRLAKRLLAPLLLLIERWRLSRHASKSWQERRAD